MISSYLATIMNIQYHHIMSNTHANKFFCLTCITYHVAKYDPNKKQTEKKMSKSNKKKFKQKAKTRKHIKKKG